MAWHRGENGGESGNIVAAKMNENERARRKAATPHGEKKAKVNIENYSESLSKSHQPRKLNQLISENG